VLPKTKKPGNTIMKKTIYLLLMTAITCGMASCSKHNKSSFGAKTYVIVPGAWSAPYAWGSVKTDLENAGNKVVVIQLPGHGTDQTPPQGLTLDTYKNIVINTIDSIGGKVILVGHSFGGVIISDVAESIPSKIEKLVYIAAFVPVSGQSALALASTDTTSVLGANLVPSEDGLTLGVVQNEIVPSFIQDGTTAEQNLVLANFRAEPLIPLTDSVSLTTANYGSVSKVYIKTLMDHAITPTLQGRMLAATPTFSSILAINTSHSAFLVMPDSVAALLAAAAN
jgi:pimeloyl-ACP methyl ester carboxylesterase